VAELHMEAGPLNGRKNNWNPGGPLVIAQWYVVPSPEQVTWGEGANTGRDQIGNMLNQLE